MTETMQLIIIEGWFMPDPAEQFHNPYLVIGNNPVMYVDPDGEFITWSIHPRGFSIGVNFTPIGIGGGGGLNFSWGDGFSIGTYGEVGYRVGGTGFGGGATMTQSVDYNFKQQTTTTTTSVGAFASFGPFNAGGNVASTYDLTNGQHVGYSWGLNAGIGVGNERGGVGLFVGYGSGGWNYGLGGYYDPRVVFSPDHVVLTANDDGTYTDQLASSRDRSGVSDFERGSSRIDGRRSTNLANNPNVVEIQNADGTYTYQLTKPKGHRIFRIQKDQQVIEFDIRQNNRTFTFSTSDRLPSATFFSSRAYPRNYFNFRNFNTYRDNRGFYKQPRHLNLFGNSWFK